VNFLIYFLKEGNLPRISKELLFIKFNFNEELDFTRLK